MAKPMDYKIITEDSLEDLEAVVLSHLQEGWKLIGGAITIHKIEYGQTMVLPNNVVDNKQEHRKVIMRDPDAFDDLYDDIPF